MTDEAPAQAADTATEAAPASWRDTLPEDIRDDATLGKYDSVDKLASAHINLQRHLGADKIAKPVTESDWNDVYEFLGRPEDATAYKVELAEDLDPNVKAAFDEQSMTAFKAEAHKLGLNNDQVQGLVNFYAGNMGQQYAAMQEQQAISLEDGEKALAQEWGRAYEQNVGFAQKAALEYGGEELIAVMEASGLGNHPAVLKTFANIAKTTMADKDLAGPTNNGEVRLTPQEARTEAAKIMGHPAYLDKRHPEHNAVVQQVTRLFQNAHG